MVRLIVRVHRPVLVVAALATVLAAVLLGKPGLKEDYRLEAFVASHDETYQRFCRFMEEFSSNEVAVIAIHGDDATSPDTVALIGNLVTRVRALPSVQRVVAITEIPPALRAWAGDRLLDHPLFRDNVISRDRRTAAIVMQMLGEAGDGRLRRTTVARLRTLVADAQASRPDRQVILAGPYVTLIDMHEYVHRDLLVFSAAALVLLGVTLWIVFRRVAPMLYAMAVSLAAILCTLGLAVVCGFVTSLITQMVVILVVVLSVASCVHLAVASEETATLMPGVPWREQAMATLSRMSAPCTAVIATMVVGFASVCISPISPIRLLGILLAFGLTLSLVFALPASVRIAGQQPCRAARTGLPRVLRRAGRGIGRRPGTVVSAFAAATLLCGLGARHLRQESDFVKNFRPDSSVRRGYDFLTRTLAPVGSLEIIVHPPAGRTVLSPECVQTADCFAKQIAGCYSCVAKAQTLADALTLLGRELPQTPLDLALRLAMIEASPDGPALLRSFLNPTRSAMRVNFRVREGLSVEEKIRVAHEVRDAAATAFGPGFTVEVTGLYYFYATLVRGLVRDQYRSLAITLPAVFVVMWIAFRSWRVAAVAMIPNLLPLVFCVGMMGWSGVPVNMTTAMMLSVTFGIAVNNAIHYLWRFRRELAACGDYPEAMIRAHEGIGRACVFTTVVIAGGFWILVLSDFLPTAYFGGLVGFTMLGALAADLLLLPALVVMLRPFGAPAPASPSRCAARG